MDPSSKEVVEKDGVVGHTPDNILSVDYLFTDETKGSASIMYDEITEESSV